MLIEIHHAQNLELRKNGVKKNFYTPQDFLFVINNELEFGDLKFQIR